MIILLFGQPASGKTTIADLLYDTIKRETNDSQSIIRIDGDKWREVTKNKDYSVEGRLRNLKEAFNAALYLEGENCICILSFVTPYEILRKYLRNESKEHISIYLKYDEDRGRNNRFANDFETPIDADLEINTSEVSIVQSLINVLQVYNEKINNGK